MGDFLSNLKYELNGSLAWFMITREMMENANGQKSDIEGFSDLVRSISGVEVALMIFEQDTSSCRINFRSKGKYSVNNIAKSLGGGGHAFAAGALISGKLGDVIEKTVNITKRSLKTQINGDAK